MLVSSDNKMKLSPHSSHWGVFLAATDGAGKVSVRPYPADPDPNPILENFRDGVSHRARIRAPMVRKGWLENGPAPDTGRGNDDFIEVSWNDALDLVASELRRVHERYGTASIFGGSYGWSSAGRFHHAQSQVHRFLNISLGGYVRSVNSYSAGAAEVILPHVVCRLDQIASNNITWDQIAEHSEIVLAFGGLPLKNSRVAAGGVSRHIEAQLIDKAAQRGCQFVGISPQQSDMPVEAAAKWICVNPGTDTALMLAMAYTLVVSNKYDKEFIKRYCDGWEPFSNYLLGKTDRQPKSAEWAAPLCGVSKEAILDLTYSLVGKRVLIGVAHALQRSEQGEQPVWMGLVLAAMLGQIGLPGGGYNYALGTFSHYGRRTNSVPLPTLSQGDNLVDEFIPVARIADALLNPGDNYDYNGKRYSYPHLRLAYWAGGNPFHHHQDLARLADAFAQLDTLIVHESAWTATARHADIVLPCTMSLEREDIGASRTDPLMVAMHQVCTPFGLAKDDYEIFCQLAHRMGCFDAFSEGRTAREWLHYLYEPTRKALEENALPSPEFEQFWRMGYLDLPQLPDDGGLLRAFRHDPQNNPLPTPSGKIQISSSVVASFQYSDCPGHPAWLDKEHAPSAEYPFWLVANQPASRLHSQLDFGMHSQSTKQQGREVCTMHSDAARRRGIKDGDAVRIFNARGSVLAVARYCDAMHEAVIQLPTGAWLDKEINLGGNWTCRNGNPNVLTFDKGTSSLAQGCSGQLCAVDIAPFTGKLPPIRAYDPPNK